MEEMRYVFDMNPTAHTGHQGRGANVLDAINDLIGNVVRNGTDDEVYDIGLSMLQVQKQAMKISEKFTGELDDDGKPECV